MKNRIALILAIILGVAAAFFLRKALQEQETKAVEQMSEVIIVVAAKDIKANDPVDSDMFKKQSVPAWRGINL